MTRRGEADLPAQARTLPHGRDHHRAPAGRWRHSRRGHRRCFPPACRWPSVRQDASEPPARSGDRFAAGRRPAGCSPTARPRSDEVVRRTWPHRTGPDRQGPRRPHYQRFFVSKPGLTGKPLAELPMPDGVPIRILHVRRYDVDLVPSPDLMLEIGDRVGVLVAPEQIATARAHFGDTVKAAAEFSYVSIGLGMVLGVLLGLVPIPVPGVGTVTLGIGGGPLIVALDPGTAAPHRADQLGDAAAGQHRAAEFRPDAVPGHGRHQLRPGFRHDRGADRAVAAADRRGGPADHGRDRASGRPSTC